MLLDIVYEKLNDIGVKNYVIEADIAGQLSFVIDDNIHFIRDVRSATFYACGLSQQLNTSVALFIRKEYLPSAHTGLMEAWFQNRHIIVVAFGADILNDDYSYLKTCTCSQIKIQTNSDANKYIQDTGVDLPELFLIENKIEDTVLNEGNSIFDLNNLSIIPDIVFLYEKYSGLFYSHPSIVNIPYKDKYGCFSKYVGYCNASDAQSVLIVDSSLLFLDFNIFNNRYMNNKCKILVIGDFDQTNVFSWLKANHVTYFDDNDPLNAISRLMKIQHPTIAFCNYPFK